MRADVIAGTTHLYNDNKTLEVTIGRNKRELMPFTTSKSGRRNLYSVYRYTHRQRYRSASGGDIYHRFQHNLAAIHFVIRKPPADITPAMVREVLDMLREHSGELNGDVYDVVVNDTVTITYDYRD